MCLLFFGSVTGVRIFCYRTQVCDFAERSDLCKTSFRDIYNTTEDEFKAFVKKHRVEGKWANDFMVSATSCYLGMHIKYYIKFSISKIMNQTKGLPLLQKLIYLDTFF